MTQLWYCWRLYRLWRKHPSCTLMVMVESLAGQGMMAASPELLLDLMEKQDRIYD